MTFRANAGDSMRRQRDSSLNEPIQPLKLHPAHPTGGASFGASPDVKTAADTHPQSMLADRHAFGPSFLAQHPQGHQHEIELQRPELSFNARPGLGT